MGASAVAPRLLLDQLAFAPCFIPAFVTSLLYLEGHPQPLAEAQSRWWSTLQANWRLWVPAQLINFAVVPIHFQVLFANGVAVCWNIYLSWATHRTPPASQQHALKEYAIPGAQVSKQATTHDPCSSSLV